MAATHTLWQAMFRSIYNSLRYDKQMRLIMLIGGVAMLGLGIYLTNMRTAAIAELRAAGDAAVNAHLWTQCLALWGGTAVLTMLSLLRDGFNESDARLLVSLPLQPATRFRSLYGSIVVRSMGALLLLGAVITGISLIGQLGETGLRWFLLILLGTASAVWVAMLAVFLFLSYVLPNMQVFRWLALGLAAVAAVGWRLLGPALAVQQGPAIGAPSWLALIAGAGLVLLGLGPLAGWGGRLYLAAFHILESRDKGGSAITIPGVRAFSASAARQRTLGGALLYKGLLSQSRHPLGWGRFVVLLVILAFFPQINAALGAYQLSPTLITVAFASGLTMLAILEYAPYAISSEGNRLTIYLATPLAYSALLWAKLRMFLMLVVPLGLALSLLAGVWLGQPLDALLLSALLTLLISVGYTGLLVLGSVFDEDLHAVVEGPLQSLLYEEVPMTLGRVLLVLAGLVLLAAELALLWWQPPLVALGIAALLNGALLLALWQAGQRRMRVLVQRG